MSMATESAGATIPLSVWSDVPSFERTIHGIRKQVRAICTEAQPCDGVLMVSQ